MAGVDIHEAGVAAANEAAAAQGLADRGSFVMSDAREPLPFDDDSFDALVCIDAINHIYERERVLAEWHRVLRPGAPVLFTDPITVSGIVRREELIVRSRGLGEFVFTPPGVDERLLREAEFGDIEVDDATANMATVSAAWRDARARHSAELDELEGAEANARYQEFLGVVSLLAHERRLTRPAYLARKPG